MMWNHPDAEGIYEEQLRHFSIKLAVRQRMIGTRREGTRHVDLYGFSNKPSETMAILEPFHKRLCDTLPSKADNPDGLTPEKLMEVFGMFESNGAKREAKAMKKLLGVWDVALKGEPQLTNIHLREHNASNYVLQYFKKLFTGAKNLRDNLKLLKDGRPKRAIGSLADQGAAYTPRKMSTLVFDLHNMASSRRAYASSLSNEDEHRVFSTNETAQAFAQRENKELKNAELDAKQQTQLKLQGMRDPQKVGITKS